MTTDPVSGAKGVAAGVGMAGIAAGSAPMLGTTADVLLVACAGALFGLAYTDPELWKRLLAPPDGGQLQRVAMLAARVTGLTFTTAANAWASAISVQVLPHLPMLDWTGNIAPTAAAGAIAFGGQHLIPRALDAGKRWLDGRAKT